MIGSIIIICSLKDLTSKYIEVINDFVIIVILLILNLVCVYCVRNIIGQ